LTGREVRELFQKLTPRSVPSFELDVGNAKPPEHFAERFANAVPAVDRPPPE
jgi:hypothetical protein